MPKCSGLASYLSFVTFVKALSGNVLNLESITQKEIDKALVALIENEKDWESAKSLVSLDFGPGKGLRAKWIRTIFVFGGPLEGYKSIQDRPKEQEAKAVEFHYKVEAWAKEWNSAKKYPNQDITAHFISTAYLSEAIARVTAAITDYIPISLILALVFLSLFMKSFFLALFTLLGLLLQVGPILFVYRAVLGIDFLNPGHVMAIFVATFSVILNSLVFYRIWEQSGKFIKLIRHEENRKELYLERRLSYTL